MWRVCPLPTAKCHLTSFLANLTVFKNGRQGRRRRVRGSGLPHFWKLRWSTPRNLDISVTFFLETIKIFAFSNIFKIKWSKSEETLLSFFLFLGVGGFGCLWIRPPPPPIKTSWRHPWWQVFYCDIVVLVSQTIHLQKARCPHHRRWNSSSSDWRLANSRGEGPRSKGQHST